MIIAPPLDRACEARKAIQVEASGLIEEVLDIGHKVHWTGLLEGQGFLLMLEEVVKELLLNPRQLCLPKGGNAEPVVDPEDLLPTSWDHGGQTLADLPTEVGFFQVLVVVVGHKASTQRADFPPGTAAAHLPSPVHLLGD